MNDDELKHLWQTQPVPAAGGDVNVLATTARQKHRQFRRTIFWRDFREVGVAVLLIPYFLFWGGDKEVPWEKFLIVLALVFVGGFMIVDRLRQRKGSVESSAPVVDVLGQALAEVEHQIWLLRHVLWWYIGPLMGALSLPQIYRLLNGIGTERGNLVMLVFYFLLGYGVWRLNQYAVKKDLEPRREELRKLLEDVRGTLAGGGAKPG